MLSFLLLISEPAQCDRIEHLYRTFHDDMLRIAKSRLQVYGRKNYEMDAEDVVQGAFMKMTKYVHAIKPDADDRELEAYVMAILSHEICDFVKDGTYSASYEEYEDYIEDGRFFEQMRISERYDEVVEAIERLDEKYSVSMLLRYRDEMSVKEIAKLMEIPEKTVYTRLERGKKRLLELLDKEG